MRIERINKAKTPIVKIDKRLNKFQDQVVFPEKLEAANKVLSKVALPKLPDSKG